MISPSVLHGRRFGGYVGHHTTRRGLNEEPAP